jgi:glycosyltransferase involved in cell wall biosynthesis
MKIAVTSQIKLPVNLYGGAERVIWDLCYELNNLGHEVCLIAPPGSRCDFAQVVEHKFHTDISKVIPDSVDIVHFFSDVPNRPPPFFIYTLEGNASYGEELSQQTVFVSQNQALRHGGDVYVHNSLTPRVSDLSFKRENFHFLGKAAWRRKNVRGAIKCAKQANCSKIDILGGTRLNFNMGFRFTLDRNARFHGMVDDKFKEYKISRSRGLVFPVLWNDPCPLSICESLYWGAPIFGTPYGSLPELVPAEVGFLSSSADELAEAMKDSQQWKPNVCRDYAVENFNSKKMALSYVEIYERVLAGETLNNQPPSLKKPEPKLLPFD